MVNPLTDSPSEAEVNIPQFSATDEPVRSDSIISSLATTCDEMLELVLVSRGIALLSYSFGSIDECNKFLLEVKAQCPSFRGIVRVALDANASE